MSSQQSRRVHEPYIFTALLFALTAGFGLAALTVAAPALRWPLGAWWPASVQAHGHAQLFGWTGLFVLGVGLVFLPRLRGAVLAYASVAPWALACFALGISLHVASQLVLAAFAANGSLESAWGSTARLSLAVSGVAEFAGAVLILVMLASSFRRARPLAPDAPIIPVRHYLALGLGSFMAASLLNALLAAFTAIQGSFLYPFVWDQALIHIMIMGFVIPIALALSIRSLPLFMRLGFPPRDQLTPLLGIYVGGLVLQVSGELIEQLFGVGWGARMGGLGIGIEAAALLVFIWWLDVLSRRRRPWTDSRVPTPPEVAAKKAPTRPGYPDYGEFGRFELLVISAYWWLVFACLIALLNGISLIAGATPPFNPDIVRHSITIGFITQLIFGMAVRLLPGLSGKRKVASTGLVLATFWLGNLAALFRVAPLFVPEAPGATAALASSGAIGWLAVACLGVNLWRTFRQLGER